MTNQPTNQPTNHEDLIKPAVDYWAGFISNGSVDIDRELGGMEAAYMLLARAHQRRDT